MNQGGKIAGGNPKRGRVNNDYYATHPNSTKKFLEVWDIQYPALEPACGEGHISKLLDPYRTNSFDFLITDFNDEYNTVITNPPFKLFKDFVEKGLKIAKKHVIMFGKLQALEGDDRATYFEKTPLKYVYVFKKRQQPLRNGSEIDELTGKKMNSSTMAFAWYVWEIGYEGEPIIRWI